MYISHFKANINFLLLSWVKMRQDSSSCHESEFFLLLWKWVSYIVHNLENYSSEQKTVCLNQDTNLKRVMCFMHMHQVMYSTKNNIYVTASYAKIDCRRTLFNLKAVNGHFPLCGGYTQMPTHQPIAYPRVFESL